jgi:hypothetical protein
MARVVSIAWNVLVRIVELVVVLAVFQIPKSPFEKLVVAGLVLTYLSVMGAFVVIGLTLSKKWELDQAQFIRLAKALHLDTELQEEVLEESREKSEKATINLGITSVFRYLLWLIAAANLLYVLWQEFA